MKPRQAEAQRKALLVKMELLYAPETGISAKEISEKTGVGYHMVWEYIRRLRNDGLVESLVTVTTEGQRHRMVKRDV